MKKLSVCIIKWLYLLNKIDTYSIWYTVYIYIYIYRWKYRICIVYCFINHRNVSLYTIYGIRYTIYDLFVYRIHYSRVLLHTVCHCTHLLMLPKWVGRMVCTACKVIIMALGIPHSAPAPIGLTQKEGTSSRPEGTSSRHLVHQKDRDDEFL